MYINFIIYFLSLILYTTGESLYVYVFNFQKFYLFFMTINNFIVLGNELYINNQFILQNHKYFL